MLKTTVGQILINSGLPNDMRNYNRSLDRKGINALLAEVAEKHPDKYSEIAKYLSDVGRDVAYSTGGNSFGLEHLQPPPAVLASRIRLRRRLQDIMAKNWPQDYQAEKIIEATDAEHARLKKEVIEETSEMSNPLAMQVQSGARGSPMYLNRLIGGDMLYMDHHDNIIPFPVQKSYSEGLSPAEYWAGTFGARKGLIATKFSTADSGFFSKQLNQLAHRLLVTAEDDDKTDKTRVAGLPVATDDTDNVGALLASPIGGYDRNTILTPKILADLDNRGFKRLLVRSPIVGGPDGGGVYARDVGIRERGTLPNLGDAVGLGAAQALGEKLTQGQLSAKHSGGVKGEAKSVSGFQGLNQLIQVPKTFKAGASHAKIDGHITKMDDAPAGGKYVWVNEERHYVSPGFDVTVKKGDTVEAGDVLSDGIPNPAEIVKYKGIGEGRRYFVQAFTQAYRDAGMGVNRRNVELIARGLIDNVEILDETDDNLPGDLVSYSRLERDWVPRDGTISASPKQAVGKYLERPVLHYTIGTQVKPSMLADLDNFGVKTLDVHAEKPPFEPKMVRAMETVSHDPDWLTRFIGSGQKRSLLGAVYSGGVSDTASTSFVPALVAGKTFGTEWPQNVLKPTGG